MVILVKVNKPNLARLHVFGALNQVYLSLVVGFPGVFAGHVEGVVLAHHLLIHYPLHTLLANGVAGDRIKGELQRDWGGCGEELLHLLPNKRFTRTNSSKWHYENDSWSLVFWVLWLLVRVHINLMQLINLLIIQSNMLHL